MTRTVSRLTPSILFLALLGCTAAPTTSSAQAAGRLLFLGNSLTYTWDIPAQVSQMATRAGKSAPTVVVQALPDYGLEDHWNGPDALPAIRQGKYDILIMQQGPSTLPASGVDLTKWTVAFAGEARQVGTRSALYAVWPPRGGNIDAGIANHVAAADSARIGLFPVAQAWREALRLDPALPLFGPDDFHPSKHGAWLAAVVITAMIFDLPPDRLDNLFPSEISAAQATTIRRAASTAITNSGRTPR